MTVANILKDKGNRVHTISPQATVLDATRAMNDARVGSIVVSRGGKIEGILRQIAGFCIGARRLLDQAFGAEKLQHARHGCCSRQRLSGDAGESMRRSFMPKQSKTRQIPGKSFN